MTSDNKQAASSSTSRQLITKWDAVLGQMESVCQVTVYWHNGAGQQVGSYDAIGFAHCAALICALATNQRVEFDTEERRIYINTPTWPPS